MWAFLNLEIQPVFRLQIANTGLPGAQVKASVATQGEGKSKWMCVCCSSKLCVQIMVSVHDVRSTWDAYVQCLLKISLSSTQSDWIRTLGEGL